ncbi:MAG: hypothetical protein CMF26_02140 [Kiloniella sp.]|nr:hypothetical protein [Kiloniella sp.]
MTFVIVLKFFHFFSLLLAGGIAVGSVVIQRAHLAAGAPPSPPTARAMRNLGLLGLLGITLLWITGALMLNQIYGSFIVHAAWWGNFAFYAKLLGASVIAVLSVVVNLHMARASAAQRPPNAQLMGTAAIVGRIGLFLALAGTAIAFTGS